MHIRLLAIAILLGWSQVGFSAHGDGREHVIPLFMAVDDEQGRQGFMRVINHSNRSGTVEIHAYDDMGMEFGPVELSLEAGQTVHFNSDHLEGVDTSAALDGSLGNGTGFWRLVFSSTLDIEPLAYFRNKDTGFLASLHDVASETDTQHLVPIFNPGSNMKQESWLRVINLGDEAAMISITGVDDDGAAGEGSVTDTVPVGGAYYATAAAIEQGGLGDGTGKWSLKVTSDQPVQVMSMMNVAEGQYLSNLSAGRRDYRGAAGLYQVSFEDGMGGDGFIILLPDSRLYAWLPETGDTTRIARAVYGLESGMIAGSGVVYESGDIPLDGLSIAGAPDDVTFSARFRSGDWIRGSYEVAGDQPRNFTGYAYTGFERGGATQTIEGVWSPMGTNPDLPAELDLDVEGTFAGSIDVAAEAFGPDPLTCDFSGDLDALNAAFSVYEGKTVVDCVLIAFGGETDPDQVELIMSVMDDPDMPGMVSRAVVFLIMPHDEKIALGALYER